MRTLVLGEVLQPIPDIDIPNPGVSIQSEIYDAMPRGHLLGHPDETHSETEVVDNLRRFLDHAITVAKSDTSIEGTQALGEIQQANDTARYISSAAFARAIGGLAERQIAYMREARGTVALVDSPGNYHKSNHFVAELLYEAVLRQAPDLAGRVQIIRRACNAEELVHFTKGFSRLVHADDQMVSQEQINEFLHQYDLDGRLAASGRLEINMVSVREDQIDSGPDLYNGVGIFEHSSSPLVVGYWRTPNATADGALVPFSAYCSSDRKFRSALGKVGCYVAGITQTAERLPLSYQMISPYKTS